MDPYSRSLSLYMGPGHARYELHNAIEAVAHQVARLVGFHAVRQPMDLVAHAKKGAIHGSPTGRYEVPSRGTHP